MKSRGTGQILQISSVLGFIGLRDSAVYVASKHAVNGFVKSLAYELRGTGVRVWAACPGRTESEFRQVALGDQPARSEPGPLTASRSRRSCVRSSAGSTAARHS